MDEEQAELTACSAGGPGENSVGKDIWGLRSLIQDEATEGLAAMTHGVLRPC